MKVVQMVAKKLDLTIFLFVKPQYVLLFCLDQFRALDIK